MNQDQAGTHDNSSLKAIYWKNKNLSPGIPELTKQIEFKLNSQKAAKFSIQRVHLSP